MLEEIQWKQEVMGEITSYDIEIKKMISELETELKGLKMQMNNIKNDNSKHSKVVFFFKMLLIMSWVLKMLLISNSPLFFGIGKEAKA